MSLQIWDAAVIGGGPAGCSTAISLAQQGLRVILFEAATYPHDKMCGEFLSPECAGLLDRLGVLDKVIRCGPRPISTVLLTAPDGTAWEAGLPGTALGLSRRTLDALLAERAQQAGATLRQGTRVTSVAGTLEEGFEVESAGPDGTTTTYARAVIGAYGKRAALDRFLARPFLEQRQPYIALKAHFNGPPIPNRIELHAFPGGYCGMSEIEGDSQVVCLLAHEQVFQEKRGEGSRSLDGFIEWMQSQNLYLRSWFQWSERIHERWITISQVPFVPKRVVERDVLMTGDAAGLIVPLAGDGISMALEGGLLASEHIQRFLAGSLAPHDVRRQYPADWNRKFGTRVKVGRSLQPLMLHPGRVSMILRLINAVPALGQYFIRRTRGETTLNAWEWQLEQRAASALTNENLLVNGGEKRGD